MAFVTGMYALRAARLAAKGPLVPPSTLCLIASKFFTAPPSLLKTWEARHFPPEPTNYRNIRNGQHCIHYQTNTPDTLADVEAWYTKQMPNAKSDDINKDWLYGSYFKLDGIKKLLGDDIVNIYRMANQKTTSIELFKCKDAAHG